MRRYREVIVCIAVIFKEKMFKEMLRIGELCAVIGFTKDMIESLLTKKEAYNIVEKLIPKNTDVSLISKMMFSELRKIRSMITN